MAPQSEVRIAPDPEALSQMAAELLVDQVRRAVYDRGRFNLVLAGGSTPQRLYRRLALEPGMPTWEVVHLFWGDERPVPPDHPDSNYRAAYETLISQVVIPQPNVHRIPAELGSAEQAAQRYELELRSHFQLHPPRRPRFDLVLLGMGADGHTASLFPGSSALAEQTRLVVAPWIDALQTHRITLTAPAINQAAVVIFLVSGADKAEALRAVLEEPHEPERWPSQLIQPLSGRLLWMVDRAAAGRLTATSA